MTGAKKKQQSRMPLSIEEINTMYRAMSSVEGGDVLTKAVENVSPFKIARTNLKSANNNFNSSANLKSAVVKSPTNNANFKAAYNIKSPANNVNFKGAYNIKSPANNVNFKSSTNNVNFKSSTNNVGVKSPAINFNFNSNRQKKSWWKFW